MRDCKVKMPKQFLPDSANVCLPPAATIAILTPGLSETRQGSADMASSVVVLSEVCLAVDNFLRLVPSSPTLLSCLDMFPLLCRLKFE